MTERNVTLPQIVGGSVVSTSVSVGVLTSIALPTYSMSGHNFNNVFITSPHIAAGQFTHSFSTTSANIRDLIIPLNQQWFNKDILSTQ